MSDKLKTYFIRIECDGITYLQVISDKEDLEILQQILEKIKRDSNKVVESNSETINNKINE